MADIITTPVGVTYDPNNAQYPFWNSNGGSSDPKAVISVTCNKSIVGDVTTYRWQQQHADLSIDTIIAQEFSTKDGVTFTPAFNGTILSFTNDGGLPNPPPVNLKGDRGEQGQKGETGAPGAPGAPGFSPKIALNKYEGGTQVVITDSAGTKAFNVPDGAQGPIGLSPDIVMSVNVEPGNTGYPSATVTKTGSGAAQSFTINFKNIQGVQGEQGDAGVSPSVTIADTDTGHSVTITDASGSKTFNVNDGSDGEAGFSPTVSVQDITGGHTVTFTDVSGSQSFNVMDGGQGAPGKNAPVPTPAVSITAEGDTPGANVTVSGTEDAPIWTFAFSGIKGGGGGGGTAPSITMTVSIAEDGGETRAETVRSGTDEAPTYAITLYNINGTDGTDGTDGYSPTAKVAQDATGATITITDKNGTTTADVKNGKDGADGVSPSIMSTPISGGHRVDILDAEGSESFDVMDGADGADGFTPTITAEQTYAGATITITNKTGSSTVNILNGETGVKGDTGAPGPAGTTPDITITASQNGEPITVTKTGTESAPIFDFSLEGGAGGASNIHFLTANHSMITADEKIPRNKKLNLLLSNNSSSTFSNDTIGVFMGSTRVCFINALGSNPGNVRIGAFGTAYAYGTLDYEIPAGTSLKISNTASGSPEYNNIIMGWWYD